MDIFVEISIDLCLDRAIVIRTLPINFINRER